MNAVATLLVVLGTAAPAAAVLPADPCRGFRVQGSGATFSCPQLGRITRTLSRTLSESVARSVPIIAASAGFTYQYDSESDTFRRASSLPGQLYLETPDPVGRGRWNVNFSYQHVGFDTFDGKPLDDLRDVSPPLRLKVQSSGQQLEVPVTVPFFSIDPEIHQFAFSATYGVTSALDVNVTLPLVYSIVDEQLRFTLPQSGVSSCAALGITPCPAGGRRTHFGPGDLFLRAKYRVLDTRWVDAAGGLVLSLPTGSPDDLSGTGATQVSPLVYAAGEKLPLGHGLSLRPYLNAGITFDATSVDDSQGRWGLGVDLGILERATFGVSVLARYPFSRTGPPGAFDVPRCGAIDAGGCERGGTAPLFGLDNQRVNYYQLSLGLRVNLWRDVLIGFANALVPLGDAGLRTDVIPLVGVEAAF